MPNNPYLDDSADDDILNPKPHEATTSTSNGRKVYSVRTGGSQSLPPELQGALAEYVDTDFAPTDIGSKLPIEFRTLAWMCDYFASFSRFHADGPLLQAVAEVLDEMTEGAVTMRYRLNEARRKIIWTQSIKRILNLFLEGVYAINESNSAYAGEFSAFINAYAEIVNFVYDSAVNQYRALSAKIGKEVDEDFVQSGILTERSELETVALGFPPARADSY